MKPSGKTTQAELAVSGTVVWQEPTANWRLSFPYWMYGRGGEGSGGGGEGRGRGQNRKWPRRRVMADSYSRGHMAGPDV